MTLRQLIMNVFNEAWLEAGEDADWAAPQQAATTAFFEKLIKAIDNETLGVEVHDDEA